VVYAAVAVTALLAVGPDVLAASSAPLVSVVEAGSWAWAVPVVKVGAAVGSLGVLLSLLVGVSRTTFAMAGARDLPAWLDSVHRRHRIPDRAEVVVGAIVIVVVLVADLRGAIGFSSFAVLLYYAVANASAWTLTSAERRWPRALSALGLAGCVVVAFSLPIASVIGGVVVVGAGLVLWWVLLRARPAT
jgi:APA family basic amino acid/polyamine antiporter